MQQYMQIKEENKDCILFYRLGDFYEMFFDDALTASKELEITLTGKTVYDKGKKGYNLKRGQAYLQKLYDDISKK